MVLALLTQPLSLGAEDEEVSIVIALSHETGLRNAQTHSNGSAIV